MRCTTTTALFAIAAGAPIAFAQATNSTTTTQPEQKDTGQRSGLVFMHSEDLLGTDVQSAATGENLGDITDVIMSARGGEVEYFIISAGGFLGMGEELIAVPDTRLRFDPVDEAFTINATEESLEDLPSFDADEWPNLREEEWADALTAYADDVLDDNNGLFGEDEGWFDEDDDDGWITGKDTLIRLSDVTGTDVRSDPRSTQPREEEDTPDATTESDGISDRADADMDLYEPWPVTLQTSQEQIGEIDAVIIEMTSHQVPFAIIESGGFLGLGEENRVVPWEALTVQTGTLVLNGIAEEEFESLESVTKSEIEAFNSAQDVLAYYEPFDSIQPREFDLHDELTMAPGDG